MDRLWKRLASLAAAAICVAALLDLSFTVWIEQLTPEELRVGSIRIVWLNFGLEVVIIGLCLFMGITFIKRDRRRRAEDARINHLADVALLFGGLAHEIRNHLHALQSRIGLFRKTLATNDAALARMEKLDEIADGMEELLNNFLAFARAMSWSRSTSRRSCVK
jgi:signal transduction histidine kinase